MTIEEAIKIRQAIKSLQCRATRDVLSKILSGEYDKYGQEAAVIAQEDIEFLTKDHLLPKEHWQVTGRKGKQNV